MLKNKVILIVLDGCRYDTAMEQMGYLNSLVLHGKAQSRKIIAEMPSNSRPLYEVLLTGTPMHQNGIYSNLTVKRSTQKSLFEMVKESGGKTGAASYYWISELYNRAPYNILTDRFQADDQQLIQRGIFYSEDDYPDSHVFADAHKIIIEFVPDFMLVHTMNIDDAGHKYTSASKEYMAKVNQADTLLAYFTPLWLEHGYQVIVTADHGMDELGMHGGSLPQHREVPFFLLNGDTALPDEEYIPQLQLLSILTSLLGTAEESEVVIQ